MRWGQVFEPWDWLFDQLANPGVLTSLAFLIAAGGVTFFLLSRIIRWLMSHHLAEAVEHLLDKYDRPYRFHGIPRAPLLLIAECTAWIFALKLIAELAQPFVVGLLSPGMAAQILGVARYDWLVLLSLTLLTVLFWIRFHLKVRAYDATKDDPTGRRTRWRTVTLFARPTGALLVLMFSADLCRFSASIGADWIKASLPELAHARATANEPLLGRNYAGGLQVSVKLEPKARVAGDVGR